LHTQISNQHAEQVFAILRQTLQGNTAFAIGAEAGSWAHGLRFTLYDVRSTTSGSNTCPFDEITWDIEDALRDGGYPVTAMLKGERICMLDVDCRAAQLPAISA
jgi:hypothetical protein